LDDLVRLERGTLRFRISPMLHAQRHLHTVRGQLFPQASLLAKVDRERIGRASSALSA
jgi:hypothetical protein